MKVYETINTSIVDYYLAVGIPSNTSLSISKKEESASIVKTATTTKPTTTTSSTASPSLPQAKTAAPAVK